MCAIHRTRRWPFEVHSLAVIPAAVARTLKLVFARLPVRRAAEMCASRVNNEQTIRRAINPNAIFLLPFGVHAQPIVSGIADFETCRRFEQRSRQEEAEEGEKPGCKKCRHRRPGEASATAIDFAVFRPDCG